MIDLVVAMNSVQVSSKSELSSGTFDPVKVWRFYLDFEGGGGGGFSNH